MNRRIFTLCLCFLMLFSLLSISASAERNSEDIIILYENDVHCETEGYSKLSAMKKELMAEYEHVAVVSSGDFIQGGSLGVINEGEYIVKLMNLVGYDALTLGNHEFDYDLDRLNELSEMMDTKPICCNFQKTAEERPYFKPYSLISYGDTKVAFIGITTPATVSSTSPKQFKDENGEYIYSFNPDNLADTVQKYIDEAKNEGASYVIALSHIGDKELNFEIKELVSQLEGLDIVLDAHSHSVIENEIIRDKAGKEVILSSTGTKFEYIGKLSISEDKIETELIETENYKATDPIVDAYLKEIEEDFDKLAKRKVAFSEVDLITHGEDGERLIRVSETNLGDFCSDALRSVMDADIGYINGGGMRTELDKGDIRFSDLLNVFPFNNTVVLSEIDGRTMRDMLEMALYEWPLECSFPHVSGLRFKLNSLLDSSVVMNENEEFCGVDGQYRVYDLEVFNRETGKYEAMELDKTYTIASNNYYLVEHGSGMTMLQNTKVLRDEGLTDVKALEIYITETLNGVIGEEYSETSYNISFTEGFERDASYLYIILIISLIFAVSLIAVLIIRGRKLKNRKA